jgi:hypothetical protein
MGQSVRVKMAGGPKHAVVTERHLREEGNGILFKRAPKLGE